METQVPRLLMPDLTDETLREMCESCGKPIAAHHDEVGRWLPCVQSIGDTIVFYQTRPDESDAA